MADLIVKAAVKDTLTDHNVSSDFYEALDESVEDLLNDAAQRAEQNDRKTVCSVESPEGDRVIPAIPEFWCLLAISRQESRNLQHQN